MADWPQVGPPAPVMISPFSQNAIGVDIAAAAMAAPASAAIATANLARGYPFWLPEPITVLKLWTYSGGTIAATSVDVGVYSEDGRLLVSAGGAAEANASALQEFDVTDTVLGRGRFYMAASISSTTGTFFTVGASNTTYLQLLKAAGCWQAASAYPLPATITFAALAAALIPICGLSGRLLVV
jgi:hypothetical protein